MINADKFNKNTVAQMLYNRATYLPDCIIYNFPEHQQAYNWLKLYTQTTIIAQKLLRIGVKKGDKVALLMESRAEFVLSMFAAAFIGAITVPINTYSKKEEIKTILDDAAPTVLIMEVSGQHQHYLEIIKQIIAEASVADALLLPENVFVLGGDDNAHPFQLFSALQSPYHGINVEQFTTACSLVFTDDPVLLIYTSGTTGHPKGVLRSTASFLVKRKSQVSPGRFKAHINKKVDRLINRFKMLQLLPLYHLGGVSNIFTTLKTGNFSVVMLSHFNPVKASKIVADSKCHFIVGSPYMIQKMINVLPVGSAMFSSVKGIAFAASAINKAIIDNVISNFKNLDFFLVSYGSSEAGNVSNGICILNRGSDTLMSFLLKFMNKIGLINGSVAFADFESTPYSIGGKIDKTVQVKVRDTETGLILPDGQPGEIIIKSHRVMRYTSDSAVKESFLNDGWYRSGDLGYVDQNGLLTISGRIKRMISRGGEKISPAEVENLILTSEGVADAFVLGVPDELYGEQVCATVVSRDGNDIDFPALKRHLELHLSSFKLPAYFVSLPDLPISSTGKLAVKEIREIAMHKINTGDFYA